MTEHDRLRSVESKQHTEPSAPAELAVASRRRVAEPSVGRESHRHHVVEANTHSADRLVNYCTLLDPFLPDESIHHTLPQRFLVPGRPIHDGPARRAGYRDTETAVCNLSKGGRGRRLPAGDSKPGQF